MAVLLATATLTIAAGEQQDQARFDRAFDAAMAEHAPEFRPQPRRPTSPQEGYGQWRTSEATVSVRYFVQESAESASKLLGQRLLVLSVGTSKVSGYGDESYLLAPYGQERRLWFRQGAVILEVAAPDMGALRRLATLFGGAAASLQPPGT